MTVTDRVEIDPRVMLGKPVIRGTRIPVELLLRKLSEGASESALIDAYPRLTREDIQAAIRYAADTLAHEEVVFVTPTQAEPRGLRPPEAPWVPRHGTRQCRRDSAECPVGPRLFYRAFFDETGEGPWRSSKLKASRLGRLRMDMKRSITSDGWNTRLIRVSRSSASLVASLKCTQGQMVLHPTTGASAFCMESSQTASRCCWQDC